MFINFIFGRLMYRNQRNKIKMCVSSLCSQATATLTQSFNKCVEYAVTYNLQQK
jgi:hypothetical protein